MFILNVTVIAVAHVITYEIWPQNDLQTLLTSLYIRTTTATWIHLEIIIMVINKIIFAASLHHRVSSGLLSSIRDVNLLLLLLLFQLGTLLTSANQHDNLAETTNQELPSITLVKMLLTDSHWVWIQLHSNKHFVDFLRKLKCAQIAIQTARIPHDSATNSVN